MPVGRTRRGDFLTHAVLLTSGAYLSVAGRPHCPNRCLAVDGISGHVEVEPADSYHLTERFTPGGLASCTVVRARGRTRVQRDPP